MRAMQKKTHIKKGDLVKVLAGVDRTKQGRVLEAFEEAQAAAIAGGKGSSSSSPVRTAPKRGACST